MCGWTNERKLDQLDFMRHRGSTPSADTGPDFDHTYGTANGTIFHWISLLLIDTVLLQKMLNVCEDQLTSAFNKFKLTKSCSKMKIILSHYL